MSTEKTIQIPADLWGYGSGGRPEMLRIRADWLASEGKVQSPQFLRRLADEIERQHPPRMDEPDEFGAMVTAGTRVTGGGMRPRRDLVRHKTIGEFQWTDSLGRTYRWDELDDPKPVQR